MACRGCARQGKRNQHGRVDSYGCREAEISFIASCRLFRLEKQTSQGSNHYPVQETGGRGRCRSSCAAWLRTSLRRSYCHSGAEMLYVRFRLPERPLVRTLQAPPEIMDLDCQGVTRYLGGRSVLFWVLHLSRILLEAVQASTNRRSNSKTRRVICRLTRQAGSKLYIVDATWLNWPSRSSGCWARARASLKGRNRSNKDENHNLFLFFASMPP